MNHILKPENIFTVFILISACLLFLPRSQGQNIGDKKRQAQEFFAYGHFEEARAILANDRILSRQDKEGRFLLALCYYQLNQLDRSALLLNELIKAEKTPFPECWLYMGKIFHARHQFEKGADYYKVYLKLMEKNPVKRQLIWDEIERCANGRSLRYKEQAAFVENLGAMVNSKHDEFAPVISPSRNDRLYFSSGRRGAVGGLRNVNGQIDDLFGQYRSDMYLCNQEKGVWTSVSPMNYLLNTPQNDILLDIKSDGLVLYYFNDDDDGGSIKVDTFTKIEKQRLTSDPFPGPIAAQQGDRFPHFVNDTLVVFASKRPGGYGGFDLYKISFANGQWSLPQNLGPDVNTPYNETTPFQARDMRTLFFSTDHPAYSIGGLDIVKSVYIPEINRWIPPQNVGLPINSASDDAHFRLSKDGFSGFLSSNRKDGFGQRDIYAVYFQDFLEEMEPPPLVAQNAPPLNVPEITLSTSPTQAESTTKVMEPPALPPINKNVINETTQAKVVEPPLPKPAIIEPSEPPINPILVEDGSTLDSKDLDILNRLAQKIQEQSEQKLVITTYSNQKLNRIRQINEGMNLSEKVAAYLFQRGTPTSAIFLRAALADLSKAPNQGRIVAFHLASGGETPKGSELSLTNPWLELTQNKLQQNLFYKIQIAASQNNNLTNPLLEDYIDPMIEKLPNFAFYRYTIGAFQSYNQANRLRKELIQFSQNSAFVVPYLQGWRLEKGMRSGIARNILIWPPIWGIIDVLMFWCADKKIKLRETHEAQKGFLHRAFFDKRHAPGQFLPVVFCTCCGFRDFECGYLLKTFADSV